MWKNHTALLLPYWTTKWLPAAQFNECEQALITTNTEGIEAFDFVKIDEVIRRGDHSADAYATELLQRWNTVKA